MDAKLFAALLGLLVVLPACTEHDPTVTNDGGAGADGEVLADACASSARPSPASLDAASYDRACQTADDCVAASFAPLSCPGGCAPCPTASVSKAGAAALNEDTQRAVAGCRPAPCSGPPPACGPCQSWQLSCAGGQCALRVCDNGDCGDAGTDAAADAASTP
jgi:hypothetical protein